MRDLGPVLGAYHPIVAYNIERIRQISGLDEVSFHMSGTEAVMQAVRLARYHTRRSHLVRFSGAYHGWWSDVQPGIGNPSAVRETYTLAEMSEHTLQVLRTRRDIACVLVNPLQALHPNAGPPADSSLVDSGRAAHFDRQAYTRWLQQLRAVCTERKIALIFDEVFVGFRLALGGAQEYFGVEADLVTYGKTLGGGLPVGVVCGRHEWMKRFRDDRPGDVCLARGTFNAHPYVMGAMNEFLHRLEMPEMLRLYEGLDELWNERAERITVGLRRRDLPVSVANISVHLDGLLYASVALQLDVAVLPSCRRSGVELGWHRTADIQPELQRCGLRCRDWNDSLRRPGRWNMTAGGGPVPPAQTNRSGDRFFAKSWPPIGRNSERVSPPSDVCAILLARRVGSKTQCGEISLRSHGRWKRRPIAIGLIRSIATLRASAASLAGQYVLNRLSGSIAKQEF